MAAADSPISGMMDSSSQVSDSLVPNVYMNPVCKLGSSDMDFSDTESLVSHFLFLVPFLLHHLHLHIR